MTGRTKRTLFTLIKIIFVVLVLVFLANLYINYKTNGSFGIKIGTHNEDEIVMTDYFDQKSFEDALKNSKSNIEGLSKYDLYAKGLDWTDNADSDMDGLSDKEEIEEYGTDPAQVSTSGDFYSDGYKVAHGMDVTKYYEYQDDLKYEDNNCKEINLNAEGARDFNACVDDYTESNLYSLEDKDVCRIYSVFCYSGYVTINLSKIDKSLSADDINVYTQSFYDNEAKVAKFTQNGKKITLEKKYDYTTPYIIYLVKEKATLAKTFSSSVVGTPVSFGSVSADNNSERAYGIVYGLFTDMKIKYAKTDNEDLNQALEEKLRSVANSIMSERNASISDEDIEATTEEEVDKIANASSYVPNVVKPLPLICKYNGTADSIDSYGLIYTYYVYDDNGDLEYSSTETNDNIVMNYDVSEDILPFGNFRTEVGTNGVCAGISHLTSYVHNNDSLDMPSGKLNYNGTTYEWDVTSDPANETLFNKGLSDYKDASFLNNHMDTNKYLAADLSSGEQSFVNMINYFWAKGNNAFSINDYAKGINGKDANSDISTMGFYDGTVIRNTIAELDKGNMVDAYFLLDNSSGHVVNLIGYEKCGTSLLGKSTSGYVFYVYDCNYPSVIGTLTCEIKEHSNGQETLLYRLDIPGASYAATSGASYETNRGKMSLFVVLDDKFNVLND